MSGYAIDPANDLADVSGLREHLANLPVPVNPAYVASITEQAKTLPSARLFGIYALFAQSDPKSQDIELAIQALISRVEIAERYLAGTLEPELANGTPKERGELIVAWIDGQIAKSIPKNRLN